MSTTTRKAALSVVFLLYEDIPYSYLFYSCADYEINARFLYASIVRLCGLWTKAAQYTSSRADFVPVAYVRELSKLQDEAPETEWKDVEKVLKVAGLFQSFSHVEEKPIASASIGQVHAATIARTGEKVVIKVQHPHAKTLLMDDFVSLKNIAKIIGFLEPEYKFFGILMREWASEARKELDFISESTNIKSAKSCVDKMLSTGPGDGVIFTTETTGCVPFCVEIPRPLDHLSSENVLVMSFCEGFRIDDIHQIEKNSISKDAVMDAVAQTFAEMVYCHDIFNGDPHPGNIFLRPGYSTSNGKEVATGSKSIGFTIVLLDWGLAKRLPLSKRLGFCELTYAAATFDFGLMMDSFKTLGLQLKRENVAEDMEGIRFLLRDMAPRDKARKRIKAKMKTDMKRFNAKKKGERVPVKSDAYPAEFFFFVRVNELLHGLGSKLGVEMKYVDILKPYARMGLTTLSKKYGAKIRMTEPISNKQKPLDGKFTNDMVCLLNKLESDGDIAGAQVCVVDSNGDILTHVMKGHLGALKSKIPMKADTLVLGFSITKAITSTLVHIMVQEGYLTYDEPIAERIWKDFCPFKEVPEALLQNQKDKVTKATMKEKWQWKRSITLRHILTHTAGMWSSLPGGLSLKSLASCEFCCDAFEYTPSMNVKHVLLPSNEPGSKCLYHALSFGWLVAGCVRGAYCHRHGIMDRDSISYQEIYDNLLKSRLSPTVLNSGFMPCGAGGTTTPAPTPVQDDKIAFVDAEIDVTRILQMRREAKAMGERVVSGDNVDKSTSLILGEMRESMRGKEFILDPRIWNAQELQGANVPAAGGRFTAKSLAFFYHELGTGKLMTHSTLETATKVSQVESQLQALQGLTSFSEDTNSTDGGDDGTLQSEFGLGYQIYNDSHGSSFGHAGVGGSIGFFHRDTKTSVAIMLNKVGGDNKTVTKQVVDVIFKHLNKDRQG